MTLPHYFTLGIVLACACFSVNGAPKTEELSPALRDTLLDYVRSNEVMVCMINNFGTGNGGGSSGGGGGGGSGSSPPTGCAAQSRLRSLMTARNQVFQQCANDAAQMAVFNSSGDGWGRGETGESLKQHFYEQFGNDESEKILMNALQSGSQII